MEPSWDWQKIGFRRRPRPRNSRPGERLFRAWGGSSTMKGSRQSDGVCFSSIRPESRLDAEERFAVFEWGNMCVNVTEFIVPASTVLWVGEVHPGDPRPVLGMSFGPQVFIENPAAQSLVPISTRPLPSDLGCNWVHVGKAPRIHS